LPVSLTGLQDPRGRKWSLSQLNSERIEHGIRDRCQHWTKGRQFRTVN